MGSKFHRRLTAGAIGTVAVALLAFGGSPVSAAEPSAALKQVIAAAKKEGKLELTWGAGYFGRNAGVMKMAAGMNKMFGTNIDVRFVPGAPLVQLTSTMILANDAGRASPSDVAIGTSSQMAEFIRHKAIVPVNWSELLPGRITPNVIEGNGTSLRIFTTFPGGIVYNTDLAPYKPTKLTDLLKPEWKGKIASTPYASSYGIMSMLDNWGEAKAFDFAHKMAKQVSGLMRCNELERVASGEFVAFAMDCLGTLHKALQRKGAPIGWVIPEDLPLLRYYYLAIPANAAHPNAAKLFTVYASTPEGQKHILEGGDTDLHMYPESPMSSVIAGYRKRGVKFREISMDWALAHPNAEVNRKKAAKILAGK